MCNQLPGKRRNNGVALIGVSVLLVAGMACQRGTPAAAASRATMVQEPRPVYVAAAVEGRLPRTVIVTGTLAADEEVSAGFKVAGRVSEIAVDLGTKVRKGQILARLDPTDFRFRVEQAEAALRQVRAAGAVGERLVSGGESLAAGSAVVRLVRIHPLRLRVAVPERDAAAIRVGQEVRVHLEGDSMEHAGRVARLSPAIQEQNRTLVVEAEVANRQGVLRPGAFARAEIVVEAARPAVLVPVKAIVTFAGLERVFGVKDGLAVEKRIRTGRRVGDRVEVLDGLAAGEQVVVEPGNLTGGQPVIPKQISVLVAK